MKTESDFKHRGLRCIVVAQGRGHRCGYVEVGKLNASFGKDWEHDLLRNIDVHGGLTFSQKAQDNYPAKSKGWWFGFDCMHCYDATDPSIMDPDHKAMFARSPTFSKVVIRTKEYVEKECRSLAEQLIKI